MIKKNLKDQEIKEDNTTSKLVGTILVILSGCILYLDKIFVFFSISLSNTHGWADTETFVWHLCQTISPVLILYGMSLRAYLHSIFVPLFCYVLQFYFVIDSSMTVDRGITWLYVSGTSVFIFIVVIVVRISLSRINRARLLEKEIMEEIIKVDDKILNNI